MDTLRLSVIAISTPCSRFAELAQPDEAFEDLQKYKDKEDCVCIRVLQGSLCTSMLADSHTVPGICVSCIAVRFGLVVHVATADSILA